MIKYILTDLEGTACSINYVHKVLFPYSLLHISDFVHKYLQESTVQAALAEALNTIKVETDKAVEIDECITFLKSWITTDRKHPALKILQGLIWDKGYKNGELKAHLYNDVLSSFISWTGSDILIGIYSSGSVLAQKLLMEYSELGDITPLISDYIDPTMVGPKAERASYLKITEYLSLKANCILFLSDVPAELDAAKSAGMITVQVHRSDNEVFVSSNHHQIENFTQVAQLI